MEEVKFKHQCIYCKNVTNGWHGTSRIILPCFTKDTSEKGLDLRTCIRTRSEDNSFIEKETGLMINRENNIADGQQLKVLKRPLKTVLHDRPFHCKICRKDFFRTENLKLHMRSHVRFKRFQCEICRKDFVTGNSLQKHIHTHT